MYKLIFYLHKYLGILFLFFNIPSIQSLQILTVLLTKCKRDKRIRLTGSVPTGYYNINLNNCSYNSYTKILTN